MFLFPFFPGQALAYDTLDGAQLQWVPGIAHELPDSAVVCGHDSDGGPVYLVKVTGRTGNYVIESLFNYS